MSRSGGSILLGPLEAAALGDSKERLFVDHGPAGTGEPLTILLRPGNAGSNKAADHITVLRQAFQQLPGMRSRRPGKTVLVRVDGAGYSHDLLRWLTGQRALRFGIPRR